jgi:chromosome segregation ATPase
MLAFTEWNQPTYEAKMRMLEQMADALEAEIASLFRRAATFEEEEFLLNREVGERQTEINRLLLKLEVMRAERDRVMEEIKSISREAEAIREEVLNYGFLEGPAAESTSAKIPDQGLFCRALPGEEPRRF